MWEWAYKAVMCAMSPHALTHGTLMQCAAWITVQGCLLHSWFDILINDSLSLIINDILINILIFLFNLIYCLFPPINSAFVTVGIFVPCSLWLSSTLTVPDMWEAIRESLAKASKEQKDHRPKALGVSCQRGNWNVLKSFDQMHIIKHYFHGETPGK